MYIKASLSWSLFKGVTEGLLLTDESWEGGWWTVPLIKLCGLSKSSWPPLPEIKKNDDLKQITKHRNMVKGFNPNWLLSVSFYVASITKSQKPPISGIWEKQIQEKSAYFASHDPPELKITLHSNAYLYIDIRVPNKFPDFPWPKYQKISWTNLKNFSGQMRTQLNLLLISTIFY